MGVSQNIAELNVERYHSFSTPFNPENANLPCMLLMGMFILDWKQKNL